MMAWEQLQLYGSSVQHIKPDKQNDAHEVGLTTGLGVCLW